MKFVVIDTMGPKIVKADDIEEALNECYNNHYGFSHIDAIVRLPEDEEET